MDSAANRGRVARWRAKKLREGYKPLTVYLSKETMDMIEFIRWNSRTRHTTAKLIEMSVRVLYEKTRRNGS